MREPALTYLCYNGQVNFLPLHIYSGYSFLRSGILLPSLVATAKKRGQRYCAICDYQTLTGFPELTKLCKKLGLTPIYGADLQVGESLYGAFILEEEGYQNLIELTYLASVRALELKDLKDHQEGLFFVLDLSSLPLKDLLSKDEKEFAELLRISSLGLNNFHLGIPYLPKETELLSKLRGFLGHYPYSSLAYPSIRYGKKEDAIALQIMEAIDRDETLENKEAVGDEYYLGEEELTATYLPEELLATEALVSKCRFTFERKRGALPLFPCPEGISSRQLLRNLVAKGLKERLPVHGPEYEERVQKELEVIEKMGFSDYFLIVADYVAYAKSHGILVGPGRGSAVGSLVSFALGITKADPLRYGLIFERFLNPERQTMPDIDVDFADTRREEVISYIQEKYGRQRVARILVLQTLGSKASIRDVGKVFHYESRHIDMLAKTVMSKLTLRENYKTNEAFRTLVDSDPYYLEIVSLAAKIEGLPRQPGLHPAGVILSREDLSRIVPIAEHDEAGFVAQYETSYLEEQGCLKMDLLSLTYLTLIERTLSLLEKQGINLTYENIPIDDKAAIALIAQGKTVDLFQLESAGMNRAIKAVKPTTFEDIVAIISLHRPGPMDSIPTYARRKNKLEPVRYLHPALEPCLKETYGVLVYQEQILQIARDLAGFSLGQADLFRRAVSKKDAAKMQEMRQSFIDGCLRNGIDAKSSVAIYDLIAKFASYGFAKSHAVAYAALACQLAYLKAHYPLALYAAMLDGISPGDETFGKLLTEIKTSGIRLLLPNINESQTRFCPKTGCLLPPLNFVSKVTSSLASFIVNERELHGPFKDIFDFASRIYPGGLDLTAFIRLIDGGCFDGFGFSRASLRLGAPLALDYASTFAGIDGNVSLGLSFPKPEIPVIASDRTSDLLAEKEALGIMISGSPLDSKEAEIEKKGLKRLSRLLQTGEEGTYAGVLSSVKAIRTKKGSRMAFVTLYDEESVVEAVLFEEDYNRLYPILKDGNLVAAKIRPNRGRDGFALIDIERI